METPEEIKNELRIQIETELDYCDAKSTPIICANLTDPQKKATLVTTISNMCIDGKMTISNAIIQIEQLYSINDID